jgi:thiamine biosynthesis lipoprotein
VVALGGETMGTTWRVLAVAPPPGLAAAIQARLDGLVAEMSHYDAGSYLSRFNRAAAGTWHALPSDFAQVMDTGLAVADASGSAFDPAIGRLVDLHGFGPPGRRPAPDAGAIAAARAVSGHARLDWDPAGRRLRQPGGLALDLSGIAKGHAADALADLLAAQGVADALVEVGGEFVGRGVQPSGEPWWVDLEAPPGTEVAPMRVALHGLAIATSGDYVRGPHTIDPRTGVPATGGVTAASVIADRAIIADAWASALIVLGDDAPAFAEREGIAARLVTRDGEVLTPALIAMLHD